MNSDDAEIEALREALEHSPDNVPLRRHLGEMLFSRGGYEEAEAEFRHASKQAPQDVRVMVGLAKAFHAQGKNELALVVLEERMLKEENVPAEGYMVYTRVLLATGRVEEAVEAYREGFARDPEAADRELGERLGIGIGSNTAEVVEGRLRSGIDELDEDIGEELTEKPRIDFSSVGGMEKVKEEIQLKIILPLTNKDIYAAYGKSMGGGILLYGPPGCGKTHLARATAGEIKGNFISVGLHDVLDMWLGQSEQKLHKIFEQARRLTPCVLFFDEVDALGSSRTDMRHSGGRHVINQFLSELDGIDAHNEGVLILAATNAPWHLDHAFRRPGRFDRIIFVPPPDAGARALILRILLEGKPTESIDYEKLARKTQDCSGADLKAVVDLAIENALRWAMKHGKTEPLTTKSLLESAKGLNPSTKEWFATARNYALYANEGGLYDDILEYLNLK